MNFVNYTVGGVRVSARNEFPDFGKVCVRLRMKDKLAHGTPRCVYSLSLAAQSGESLFAINGRYASTLDVIVATIEHVPFPGKLLQIGRSSVLNQVNSSSTRFRCQFLEARFRFPAEVLPWVQV